MRYRFVMMCPKCAKTSEAVSEGYSPPPRLNCGDCLMNRVDVVEMKVVSWEKYDAEV